MAVKLDDLRQPRGIGGLPVVIRRGKSVLSEGKAGEGQEKDDEDKSYHG